MNYLKKIKYVVDNSDYVSIDYKKIEDIINQYNFNMVPHEQNELVNILSEKELAKFMLLCESINFCFWPEKNWKMDYYGTIYSGSLGMFYSMQKYVIQDKEKLLNNENLKKINFDTFKNIFITLDKPLPLIELRYKNFKNVSNKLIELGEDFFEHIFNIKTDLELLNYIVSNFSCFNDVAFYKKQKIYFYKRANLLVRDFYELIPTIQKNLRNLNNLLPCADYVIPRFLRDKGILIYSSELKRKIDTKQTIEAGSQYEVEIRANMIWCLYQIQQELKQKGKDIDLVTLDNIIWKYGKNCIEKTNNHRTLTIYY